MDTLTSSNEWGACRRRAYTTVCQAHKLCLWSRDAYFNNVNEHNLQQRQHAVLPWKKSTPLRALDQTSQAGSENPPDSAPLPAAQYCTSACAVRPIAPSLQVHRSEAHVHVVLHLPRGQSQALLALEPDVRAECHKNLPFKFVQARETIERS